jgi:hypothetical protein
MASSKTVRRQDKPHDYWTRPAPSVRLGDERFRFTVLRGSLPSVEANELVTGLSWIDQQAELTGNVQIDAAADVLRVQEGHKLRVEWSPTVNAPYRRLFTMQFMSPSHQVAAGAWTAELGSTLTTIRKSKDDYRFKVNKGHPRGWTCDQITTTVARRTGMRIGRIAKGTHRIKNLTGKDADPMDMIIKAYRAERRATGRRFFLVWDGTLNVLPLRRSRYLLEVSSAVIDATYRESLEENFATALTVRATGKRSGGKKRKISVRVSSEEGVKRYGYVHAAVTAPDADTEEEARAYGRRVLAKRMAPKRELEVTVPLMPDIRRGDAFKVEWRELGVNQVVFVAAASHSLSAGGGTTTLTARFTDPYLDTKADRDRKKKCEAARRRGRPAPSGCKDADSRKRATPKKSKRRSDS